MDQIVRHYYLIVFLDFSLCTILFFEMKHCIIFYLIVLISLSGAAQTTISLKKSHNPSTTFDGPKFHYALLPDSFLSHQDSLFLRTCVDYPLLIINGIVLEDKALIDRFRNTYVIDQVSFKKISRKKAMRKHLPYSEDGTLIVRTRKNYYIVF